MSTDRELLGPAMLELAALDEDAAHRIAHIIGPSSAAAKALAELKARRDGGTPSVILRNGSSWVVCAINLATQGAAQEGKT